MRRNSFIVVPALVLVACASCLTINAIKHNQDKAATSAIEFAKAAFVERNNARAFDLLAPISQDYYKREKIDELLNTLHPATSPTIVTATEFEPVPGQKLMNVFLVGENGDEKFYYRLELLGTEDTGYKVSGLFRANQPHPPSPARQKLPVQKSVGISTQTTNTVY